MLIILVIFNKTTMYVYRKSSKYRLFALMQARSLIIFSLVEKFVENFELSRMLPLNEKRYF